MRPHGAGRVEEGQEEEERGAEVSQQKELLVHSLAGKFLTKRVLNVEAVLPEKFYQIVASKLYDLTTERFKD